MQCGEVYSWVELWNFSNVVLHLKSNPARCQFLYTCTAPCSMVYVQTSSTEVLLSCGLGLQTGLEGIRRQQRRRFDVSGDNEMFAITFICPSRHTRAHSLSPSAKYIEYYCPI